MVACASGLNPRVAPDAPELTQGMEAALARNQVSAIGIGSCELPHEQLMSKVKHIMLLKFKEGTPQEQINNIFDNVLDITESIAGIEDYVSGPNMSTEGLAHGFTHGLIMTFSDAAARDAYLPHPEHERVKAMIEPLVDAVLVIDFEV
jgi:hypothetical protein